MTTGDARRDGRPGRVAPFRRTANEISCEYNKWLARRRLGRRWTLKAWRLAPRSASCLRNEPRRLGTRQIQSVYRYRVEHTSRSAIKTEDEAP